MTVTVTLRHEWDMGHRLPEHDGKCRMLHGHRYVAEVDATGPIAEAGPGTGMVADFGYLKAAVRGFVDAAWDHKTMLSAKDPLYCAVGLDSVDSLFGVIRVPFTPTAENIAAELLRRLGVLAPAPGVRFTRVRVYETPNGWAEVRA